MQKFTFILFILLASAQVFGQKLLKKAERTRLDISLPKKDYKARFQMMKEKTHVAKRQNAVTCENDTILYTLIKTENLIFLDFVGKGAGQFAEGIGQLFEGPQPMLIHGVEFYGRSKYENTTSAVNVSIYSADADSTPATLLGTFATTLDYVPEPTTESLRRNINFPTPVRVNGNYLVVVEAPATSSDTLQLVTNDDGDGFEERLSKLRASDANGTFWVDVEDAYELDADFFTFPIVSYDISARYTYSPNLTAGSQINFTNQSSPILFSRFYNLLVLLNALDDSFFWNFGEELDYGPAVDTSYTYATPGSYDVAMEAGIFAYRNFEDEEFCVADTVATLVISQAPFPVTVTQYNVISEKNRVKITWATAQELNNDYFEIERSLDGVNFKPLSRVNGSVNSNIVKEYTTYDEAPSAGLNYYRLVQYDKDGKKTNIRIKTADFKVAQNLNLQVYPNPATTNVVVRLNSGTIRSITITDLSGRLVKTYNPNGNAMQTISIKDLSKGVYLVNVNANGETTSQKLVVNK